MRHDFLRSKFSAYLERRSIPRNLVGKDMAIADELSSLLRAIKSFAPTEGYDDWWPKFEDAIDRNMKFRTWPTCQELKAAHASIAKSEPKPKNMISYDLDPVSVAAKRMNAGDNVGQDWIYGHNAVLLMRSGQISADTIRKYRSSLYFSMKDFYGEEKARKLEADLIQSHENAEAVERAASRETST